MLERFQPEYLLLIASPFQFICALEYLDEKEIIKENCILILITHKESTINKIQTIGNPNAFHSLKIPFAKGGFFPLNVYRLKTFINKHTNKKVIIGNLYNIWCIYAIEQNSCQFMPVVLDDGSANIHLLNKRKKGTLIIDDSKKKSKKAFYQSLILNLNKKIDRSLCFYTIFDELRGATKDIIESNNLRWLKKRYGRNFDNLNNEVWFLGTPLAEYGMIDRKAYYDIIHSIKRYVEKLGLKFKYFKHRVEKNLNIDGLTLVENKIPFEIFYLQASNKPRYIFGLNSTSLFVLSKMDLASKIVSFGIPKEYRKGDWSDINTIYNVLKKDNKLQFIESLEELI